MDQYAVLSDIHANIWALEAVLADAANRGLGQMINLGDSLYGPLEPQVTAECLMNIPVISVQGNQDRLLLEETSLSASPTLSFVQEELHPQSLAWLADQPATRLVGEELFLCHGTPQSDETYFLENMSAAGGFLKEPALIQAQLASVDRAVIVCGHSHIPRTVQLSNGCLVVNPGSVGLPAYSDDLPVAHKMETGSPHARYAVVSETAAGWSVEQIAVPYEWNKAARKARQEGQNDWAAWLESGRA